jgi:hypothetical protein
MPQKSTKKRTLMNLGHDRRIRKLEEREAARRSSRRVAGIRFLTAEQISRGLGPGLHEDDLAGSSETIDVSVEAAEPASEPSEDGMQRIPDSGT